MGCCFILSKLILFFLDFLFVLIGIIILAVGIWIVADGRSFFDTVSFFSKSQPTVMQLYVDTPVVVVSAGILIAIGALILLFSFGGCWGVVSENRCILITYATLMSFIVLVEVICVILLFACRSTWQPYIEERAQAEFSNNYKGTLGAFNVSEYDPFSLAVDSFMIQFKCCGINGSSDFMSEETARLWFQEGRTFVGQSQTYYGSDVKLPTACCVFTNQSFMADQQYSQYLSNMLNPECPIQMKDYQWNACLEVIPEQIYKQKVPMIVVPVIILVLQLTCIGLASYLAVAIKRWGEELYY